MNNRTFFPGTFNTQSQLSYLIIVASRIIRGIQFQCCNIKYSVVLADSSYGARHQCLYNCAGNSDYRKNCCECARVTGNSGHRRNCQCVLRGFQISPLLSHLQTMQNSLRKYSASKNIYIMKYVIILFLVGVPVIRDTFER